MSAIFGCIDIGQQLRSDAAGVDVMAKTHRVAEGHLRRLVCTPAAAMMSVGGLVSADCFQEGTLLVALQGDVCFEARALAQYAEEFGAAAAVGHAYSKFGLDCVKHMHGGFAVAIFDGSSHRGLLAIDRMAIRSLALAQSKDNVIFATSPGAVALHPAVGQRLSKQGIYNYLYCENVPAPGTIYEGISKLLPGQRMIIDRGNVRTDYYWRLEYSDTSTEREAELKSEFRALLRDCVARAAATDTDVGTFLSGGTDSSTVTGILTELRGGPSETYSIGFEAEGYDEMDYARIAAGHFKCRGHEYYVTPSDVADAVPLIASAYDEPFGNASAVPTYYCAKLAKDTGRSLLLAGDGGDELFGGNARYAKQKLFEAYWLLPSAFRRGLIEPVLFSGAWMERISPLRKARSYVQQARIPLPDRLEAYNFLEREALDEIFEPDFLKTLDPHEPRDIARDVFHRTASKSSVNRMMHLDLKETLADNDLRKVNGMCELAGIKVRYPLLDDKLVAFSGRLTPAKKVKGLRLRYFFKEGLRDLLPPETIAKTKHGFGLPFGLWMQRDAALKELAIESLMAFKSRGYLRGAYINHLLQQHESSHAGYYGVMIWIVMMLEQWLKAHEASAAFSDAHGPPEVNMRCARA